MSAPIRAAKLGNRSSAGVCRRIATQETKTLPSHFKYCFDLVKRHDYENFLCSLLLPVASRPAAIAIRAFNVELANVGQATRESHIGKMRMQFWKDTLHDIYKGNPPMTPVAQQLHKAINRHNLSKLFFSRLIESRESNLANKAFTTLAQLEDYAEHSVSSIFYLILESLAIRSVGVDHVASHLGKALGITTSLRAAPFYASRQGTVLLPMDITAKHKVSHEQILRGQGREQNVRDAVYEVASLAHTHLQKARSLKGDVSQDACSAFLPSFPCEAYLNKLERAQFDIFDKRVQQRNYFLPLKLQIKSYQKVY